MAVRKTTAFDLSTCFPTACGAAGYSTVFYSCLRKGHPFPALWNADGSEGPALLMERHAPGSLKWLMHPMWRLLDGRFSVTGDLRWLMASLEPQVVEILFRTHRGATLRRVSPSSRNDLERLAEVGSLDALAGYLYLSLDALLAGHHAFRLVCGRFHRRRIHDWRCLQILSRETRAEIVDLLAQYTFDASVEPEDSASAALSVAADLLALQGLWPETAWKDFSMHPGSKAIAGVLIAPEPPAHQHAEHRPLMARRRSSKVGAG